MQILTIFCINLVFDIVAIANALQLEAVPATPALCSFTYDAMPSLTLPYYSIFAADTLLYAVTLTFDPVTLTFDF